MAVSPRALYPEDSTTAEEKAGVKGKQPQDADAAAKHAEIERQAHTLISILLASIVVLVAFYEISLHTLAANSGADVRSLIFRNAAFYESCLWPCLGFVLTRFAYATFHKYYRWCWLKFFVGMSDADNQMCNEQHLWVGGEVVFLAEKYGARKLKIADCCIRRTKHVANNVVNIYFWAMVPSAIFGKHFSLAHTFMVMLLSVPYVILPTIYFKNKSGWWAEWTYCNTRVRDGNLARTNLLCVQLFDMGANLTVILVVLLLQLSKASSATRVHTHNAEADRGLLFLWVIAMWCLIFGDLMGEVVGSFFGRLEFPVYGVGEINMKTVEGTVATYLTMWACIWVSLTHEGLQQGMLGRTFGEETWTIPVFWVTTIVAFVGTLCEVLPVRSTDNWFILMGCVMSLYALLADQDAPAGTISLSLADGIGGFGNKGFSSYWGNHGQVVLGH